MGSLFSGIGGLDLGLERAGMTVRWQVEIDGYCRKVLAKHWPDVERYEDVRECGKDNLEPVDLICGGFPCQPVSCAGQRRGDADERWLWPEFSRIVRELRPRWVLAENVPGLLSADAGRLYGGILRDLAESGYDAEWDCIPAAAVGAPHIRDRVFIIAHTMRVGVHVQLGGLTGADRQGTVYADRDGEVREMADANCRGQQERPELDRQPEECAADRDSCGQYSGGCGDAVADTTGVRCSEGWDEPQHDGQFATAFEGGVQQFGREAGWWKTEPDVGRVADGVPARVDRLRGLGNAVVPAVAEWLGRRIIEADTNDHE